MNYIQPIKTISSDDLYNNYPLSSNFANEIMSKPYLIMSASSLKELLLRDPDLQSEELDEDSLRLFSFGCNFILTKDTIYYYQSESRIYLNLEKIPYCDIIISSILYVVKKYDLDGWSTVSQLLLESSFSKELSFYLIKENLLLKYRTNFIIGLIYTFEEFERYKRFGFLSKNKKYCKKKILNILALLGINELQAFSLIEKYQATPNGSYVIIKFLKRLINY